MFFFDTQFLDDDMTTPAYAQLWEDLNCDGVKDSNELTTLRDGAEMDLNNDGYVTVDERFKYDHAGEVNEATGQPYASFSEFAKKAKGVFDRIDSYVPDGSVTTYHVKHFPQVHQDADDVEEHLKEPQEKQECHRLVHDMFAARDPPVDTSVHRTKALYTPKPQCYEYKCADGRDDSTRQWYTLSPVPTASSQCACSRACDAENIYRSNVGIPLLTCLGTNWDASTSTCFLRMRATCQPESLFTEDAAGSAQCACRTYFTSHDGPCSSAPTASQGVTRFESRCVAALQEGSADISADTDMLGTNERVRTAKSPSGRGWRIVLILFTVLLAVISAVVLFFRWRRNYRWVQLGADPSP